MALTTTSTPRAVWMGNPVQSDHEPDPLTISQLLAEIIQGAASAADLSALAGGMEYQGTWDADANSPTIPSAAGGNDGYYYVVTTAGATEIDGESGWIAGDWIISNGTTWERISPFAGLFAYVDAALEGAVSAAALGYPLYADTTAGLAATSDGEGFSVLDTTLALYLNDGGAATLQGKIPLSAVTDALDTRLGNLETLGASGAQYAAGGPVVAAATGNVALTGDTNPIDGETLSNGDRYLAPEQTDPAENGIYIFNDAGAHSRATDMNTAGEVAGTAVRVSSGSTNGGRVFVTYSAVTTLDTDDIDWVDGGDFSGLQDQIDALEEAATSEDVEGGNAGIAAYQAVGGVAIGFWGTDGTYTSLVDETTTIYHADATRFAVSRNEMWSQWVWPRTVESEYGDEWHGSVSMSEGDRAGPFTVSKRSAFGGIDRAVVGLTQVRDGPLSANGNVDDHNRPAVIYNPWPSATYPLMAIQADHNDKSYARYYRATTTDPDDLTYVANIAPSGGGVKSYGQYFFKPDDPDIMRGIYRDGGASAASWTVLQRDAEADAPADWNYYQDVFVEPDLYLILTPTLAGDGLWLTSYKLGHASGGGKITLAKLLWDWSLVHPDGTEIHADLRLETNLDPLSDSGYLTVYTPSSTDRIRLFDVREYTGDDLRILFADFPSPGKSTTGDYKVSSVDLTDSSITTETICPCGGKIEEETENYSGQFIRSSGTSSYIAGAALTDRPTEVFCTRWFNTYGDAVLAIRQGADDYTLVTVDYSTDGKIARPEGHVRMWWDGSDIQEEIAPRVSYWRGSGPQFGYGLFYDFYADRVTVDLRTYRSDWQ